VQIAFAPCQNLIETKQKAEFVTKKATRFSCFKNKQINTTYGNEILKLKNIKIRLPKNYKF
jgi:hypothetical protein